MQSNIEISDEIREAFQAMRMKRKHRYVIYKANEDKTGVTVDKCGDREETWEQFKESMPKNNSR